jgi:NADPH:quinone reductase-like Zn-dependent oxidoreductase
VKRGLEAVAPLIAAGKLRINIDQTYPLAAIAKAQEHNRSGSTRGKVVIDMGVSAETSGHSP